MTPAGETLLETIRIRWGQAPLLARHAARLARSGLRGEAPDLAGLIAPHLSRGDVVIRVEAGGGREHMLATTREVPAPQPLRVAVVRTRHPSYPRKTTNRTAFDAALREAHDAGADDALLLTADGIVAEGTIWNLFWWEDGGRAGTPSPSLGILPGIGRERVGELVAVTERGLPVADLRGRSLFATNAVRGVIEIASLDGTALPPDPRTRALAARFWP